MDALGNVTTYTYNANTNVLQSVQSPRDDTSNQANNIVYRTATAEENWQATATHPGYLYTNTCVQQWG